MRRIAQHPKQSTIDQATGRDLAALGHAAKPVLAVIKAKCLDCSGGDRAEVADCLVRGCPLWPYREGRNPWRPEASAAQRDARRRSGQKAAARVRKPINGTGFGATAEGAGRGGRP